MKMFVSRGGKDCGGCLLLDYPSENAPLAVRFNGKVYALSSENRGAAWIYKPFDSIAPDENVEVVENDGPVGKSEMTARVEKIDNDNFDDPRR